MNFRKVLGGDVILHFDAGNVPKISRVLYHVSAGGVAWTRLVPSKSVIFESRGSLKCTGTSNPIFVATSSVQLSLTHSKNGVGCETTTVLLPELAWRSYSEGFCSKP